MMRAWRLFAAALHATALCGAVLSCAACGAHVPLPAAATLAAGTAVAATAINRKASDYKCWAECSHGYVCDNETSLCVLSADLTAARNLGTAEPRADEERGCIEEDDGTVLCPDDPEAEAGANEPEPDVEAAQQP